MLIKCGQNKFPETLSPKLIKKIIVLIVECHGVDTLLLPVLPTVQATNEDCHRLICGSRL